MMLINSSVFLIPSATGRDTNGLPSKRAISTALSAATITPLARAISSAVKRLPTPDAPFVSTRTVTPISSPCLMRASSAM